MSYTSLNAIINFHSSKIELVKIGTKLVWKLMNLWIEFSKFEYLWAIFKNGSWSVGEVKRWEKCTHSMWVLSYLRNRD